MIEQKSFQNAFLCGLLNWNAKKLSYGIQNIFCNIINCDWLAKVSFRVKVKKNRKIRMWKLMTENKNLKIQFSNENLEVTTVYIINYT